GNDVQLIADRTPIANAGGPYTLAEGGTVILSGLGSTDPDLPGDALSYAWDLDGDGLFGEPGSTGLHGDERGPTVAFNAGSLDGPSTFNVSLQVTDQGGLTDTVTIPVTITDAPPTATFKADATVDEGGTATLTFSGATDASAADLAAGFTYSFDFNNDGGFETTGNVPVATMPASFFLDGPATRTVHGRVTDKDGGSSDYTAMIAVNNVAPTATF